MELNEFAPRINSYYLQVSAREWDSNLPASCWPARGRQAHKVITPTASETATFASFAIRALKCRM